MESFAASAADNWFDVVQSAGIVASVLLATWTIARDHRSRLVENRLTITAHHRELWGQLAENPRLKRIFRKTIGLAEEPITEEERRFVIQVILHLNVSFYATDKKLLASPEGLRADIRGFFDLPIPRMVWKETRHLRDRKFARFVDEILDAGEERKER